MTWFLQMYNHSDSNLTTSLVEGVDVDDLAQQRLRAKPDDYVRIPSRMEDQLRESPLYLRVRDWSGFRFFHHDPEVVE